MDTITNNEIEHTSTSAWCIVTSHMAVKDLFDLDPTPYEKYQYPALLVVHDNILIICDFPVLCDMLEGVRRALNSLIPKVEE